MHFSASLPKQRHRNKKERNVKFLSQVLGTGVEVRSTSADTE